MKPSEVGTLILAIYGAILSTVAIVRQFLTDRIKVKMTVQRNMQIINHPRYKGQTLTTLTVTNLRHRPVTIKSFGAIGLYPHLSLVAIDTQPLTPCELTEGQYVTSHWDQNELDFSQIDYWAAWDSTGRVHKRKEASMFRHWKSLFQQKWHFRKERKKKAAVLTK